MKFEFENTRPTMTSEAILEDLRKVAGKRDDGLLPQNFYREHGQFSHSVVKKRFGSWNSAVQAAGLIVDASRRNIPDEELFDNLRVAWIQLGRQPRRSEMGPPASRFGREPYVRRFGSWLAAIQAFVAANGEWDARLEEPDNASPGNARYPSLRLRFLVMRRDSFKCVLCGRSPATHPGLVLHVDHVTPFSKSGRTDLANLRTACVDCNLGKGDTE